MREGGRGGSREGGREVAGGSEKERRGTPYVCELLTAVISPSSLFLAGSENKQFATHFQLLPTHHGTH